MIAQFHCLRGCLYGKSLSCNEKSRGNSYRAVNNYFEIESVEKAFIAHLRSSKFFPTPDEIINHLPDIRKVKCLNADESWAMMPMNEHQTVVWTEEMAEAYSIAYDLIVDGDRIAARMAFKGAYESLCNEALITQKPVLWKVCVGYDKDLIQPVLENAVLTGRITQQVANKYLPAPQDAGVIAGLLTGKVTSMPNNDENLRARWKELSQAMKDGQAKLEQMKHQAILDRENYRKNKELESKLIIERAEQLLINSGVEA